jgi:hypothetical protein
VSFLISLEHVVSRPSDQTTLTLHRRILLWFLSVSEFSVFERLTISGGRMNILNLIWFGRRQGVAEP